MKLPCGHGFLTCLFSGWGFGGNIWLDKTGLVVGRPRPEGGADGFGSCLPPFLPLGRPRPSRGQPARFCLSPSFYSLFLLFLISFYSCILFPSFFPSFSCFLLVSFSLFHLSLSSLLPICLLFFFPFHALRIKIPVLVSALPEPNY